MSFHISYMNAILKKFITREQFALTRSDLFYVTSFFLFKKVIKMKARKSVFMHSIKNICCTQIGTRAYMHVYIISRIKISTCNILYFKYNMCNVFTA